MTTELLQPATVEAYLAGRGVFPATAPVVDVLSGGVSNIVLGVSADGTDVVVKQALPRLRVADEWLAPTERVLAEAAALDVAGEMTPDAVPAVLSRDPDAHAIVIRRAPASWSDWKTLLLSGTVEPAVAGRLGEILARWHSATRTRPLPACLERQDAFEALRIDPYHRTVARRDPDLAPRILGIVDASARRRLCLAHGDFSPKNVLVGPAGALWIIDMEVAHRGDPDFDLAFMLTHLLLKSIHRPAGAPSYDACATRFWGTYADHVDPALAVTAAGVSDQAACLLLARVRGKSPAEYLTEDGRASAWALGTSLLARPAESIEALLQRRIEVTA